MNEQMILKLSISISRSLNHMELPISFKMCFLYPSFGQMCVWESCCIIFGQKRSARVKFAPLRLNPHLVHRSFQTESRSLMLQFNSSNKLLEIKMLVFMAGGVSGWEILGKISKWEGLVDSLTAIYWVTIYISREKKMSSFHSNYVNSTKNTYTEVLLYTQSTDLYVSAGVYASIKSYLAFPPTV